MPTTNPYIKINLLFLFFICTLSRAQVKITETPAPSVNPIAGFIAPDTVCINSPVNLTNTTTGANSYYWNFCVASINAIPQATNLGNIGGLLKMPVFVDNVTQNGNYYSFVINNDPGNLVRLDFGNSLLNTPVATNLGNFGGIIPRTAEGIQVVEANGKWQAIIVGGTPLSGSTPRILKIDFGASLANPNPIATNWGNIGNLDQPIDLYLFKDQANWYGFTVNSSNNSITRFNFGNDFSNPPTAVNLGSFGSLSYPTGIYTISDNGNWRVFVTNGTSNTVTRLDFGNSLLNIPVAVDLGKLSNTLSQPRDIYIMKFCSETVGFVVNGITNDLVKLNFTNGLDNMPQATSLGNSGNFNFPHSISQLFRVGSDIYSLVPNVSNNTITRLRFEGCSTSNVPNSSAANPPPIVYNTPGTYNINLMINEGLPTQSSFCKQIVVLPLPEITPISEVSVCPGYSVLLDAEETNATTYSWTPETGLSASNILNPEASPLTSTLYTLTASNGFCADKEDVQVTVLSDQDCVPPLPGFITPDTVCLGSSVTITNTSTGASSYFWNFCVADIDKTPLGTNLGNIGGSLSAPVFMDYVYTNGNYYGFTMNNLPGGLVRLDFGNSLLNTPTSTDLGNFGGIIPAGAEGIQIVQNEGKWYAIIVGGYSSGNSPRILKIDFGADISNPSPTATNWGNIGNMNQPIDLHIFQENNIWYGFTVSADNNTITRFNFTNSFDNTPSGVNLGNIGNLAYPTGIYAINDNGYWRVFITNAGNYTRTSGVFSLTRLDFGSSLLNVPAGVNLGNPGNILKHPRDLTIMKSCGQIIGFAVNGHVNDRSIVKLNFNNDLSAIPTAISLGNIGNLGFPHSISKLFRVNEDLYSFITNVDSHTITRLRFAGCSNASIPNSTAKAPAPIIYDAPGTYNINLTINDGLPTQSSFCRQVVVLAKPVIDPFADVSICPGNTVRLDVTTANATVYKWLPETGLSASDIPNPVAAPTATTTYTITATNTACPALSEEIEVKVLTPQECVPPVAAFITPDTVCQNSPVTITNTSVNANSYFWNFCVGNTDKDPVGLNLGSLGNTLNTPVFMDYVESNGDYYGFVVNHSNGDLVRLDFGKSLLNAPVPHMLGNFGGATPKGSEGIQVISDNGKWYAIIIGGSLSVGGGPRIVRISFGADITNATPVATNWGNIGGLTYPVDLHVFKNGDDWHGLTVNSENNTITRFDFGSSFDGTPSGVNMGNIGNLNYPTGIFAIQKAGNWHVFITNSVDGDGNNTNSSLTRLDFGNSLLNPTPAGVNLGNLDNRLISPRDLYITQFCDDITGFIVNQSSANSIVKLNFNGDLLSTPVAVDIGNIGNLSFPHSISKIFRIGSDLFSFITNVNNNTLTRLRFEGCSNASIPNANDETPSQVIYNTPGTYNINLTINDGLPTQASFCRQVVVLPKPTVDFSFEQELCNPASVIFKNESKDFKEFTWDFGDGTSLNNVPEPLRVYNQWDDYLIKLKAAAEGGCADSVTKTVAVRLIPDEVITGRDTVFCWSGNPFQLNTLPGLKYCWTPATGLSDPTIANPVISSTMPATTYYVNAMRVGRNLVSNGDFTGGNTGFISDYQYSPGSGVAAGVYTVSSDIPAWHSNMADCGDHTTGDGHMLLVNGSEMPAAKVWSQTIAVLPNTNYAFSTWLQTLTAANSARLQFSINGVQLGDIFTAPSENCNWRQFYTLWNSGSNASATIAIVNMNLAAGGNDFAMDDISFAALKMVYDSITITINANPEIDFSYDIPYCKSPQFTGIATTTPAPMTTWNWDFGDGNSENAVVLTHTYLKGGSYDVKLVATDQNTCKDTAIKTIQLDTITATVSPDTTVCANAPFTVRGSGGTIFDWSPAQVLDNPALPEPAAAVAKTTRFYLKIKNGIGCEDTDSVLITVKPRPFFMKPADRTVCLDSSLQLAGGNGDLHQYRWSPAELLDDPTAMNPLTIPPASMQYRVTVTEVPCGYDTTFTINVTVNPNPVAVAWKQRDIDCLNPTVYLGASSTPGEDIRFEWSPASGVDNPFSTRPLAWADSTTAFVLKTTNEFGCSAYDQVTVKVTNTAKPEFALANAFSPNGDGVNDCFGIKRWGNVTIHQFTIFNRWGEKVFSTSNPRECWNGIYKGKPQASGTFVYAIRATSFCGEMVKKGTVELIR